MRLLGIAQALELYQAERSNRPALRPVEPPREVLAALPAELQERLRRWAKDLTGDAFRETLAQLANEQRDVPTLLHPQGLETLVDELVGFRNHVLFRTPAPGLFFFFNDGAPPEIYTFPLPVAFPI